MFSLICYLIFAAFVFAAVEVQIEGEHGMAEKLPCWKIQNKWTNFFLGAKPLTGYHLYMWMFLILTFHLIFFITRIPWSWALEFKIIGALSIFTILEDFFWFVINPAYGVKNFRKSNPKIWWHKSWFLGVPSFFWPGMIIGISLLWLGHYLGA